MKTSELRQIIKEEIPRTIETEVAISEVKDTLTKIEIR